MIVFEQLTKQYGGFTALDRLDVTIQPGTLVGLLGANGAGKTTAIRCLTGVLRPSSGRVLVDGNDIHVGRAGRAILGVVPDRPFVHDRLTAREFVAWVAQLYGQTGPDVAARIEDVLGRFGLADRLDQQLGNYSHGMRQKVLLASAFCHLPKVLVVDEPMVGLDVHAARTLRQMLRDFTAGGGTVLLTTHTLETAERLCDRVLIISKGRLIADGTPGDIVAARRQGTDATLEEVVLDMIRSGEESGERRLASEL